MSRGTPGSIARSGDRLNTSATSQAGRRDELPVAVDCASMAAELATAEADYIVAQTYNVDGGNWMS